MSDTTPLRSETDDDQLSYGSAGDTPDDDTSLCSDEAQRGVKAIEAISSNWTRSWLVFAYTGYVTSPCSSFPLAHLSLLLSSPNDTSMCPGYREVSFPLKYPSWLLAD